ncbi:hypothetical protein [Mastigocladopsis repens]|uniref:hypothetical protein n=1 Tax=Mastigocladopsis repens TaxID=221287 RepID=UPI0002E205E2|nr:hypothetical protein [Mastigocladopsis repens]
MLRRSLAAINRLDILQAVFGQIIIPKCNPYQLNAMIDNAQYWVSTSLYKKVLQQAGELSQ